MSAAITARQGCRCPTQQDDESASLACGRPLTGCMLFVEEEAMRTVMWGWLLMIGLAAGGLWAGEVRPPAVAGQFYEGVSFALDAQVGQLLREAALPAVTGRLVAVVAPHAGYVYSGRCAASVFGLLTTGQVSRVIVLGPSHHVPFAGVSLPAVGVTAYRTPLGDVPLDVGVCDGLRGKPGFTVAPGADRREHSIEVELPFLQHTLGKFTLVPLVCGHMDASTVSAVAEALTGYVGTGTLMVASSDFTHYGPNYDFVPFETNVAANLKAWLAESSGRVAALDSTGFDRHCRETQDTICGQNPIRTLMAALQRSGLPVRGQVVSTATSGDVVGDYRNSVSYAAIGFFLVEPSGGEVMPSATLTNAVQTGGSMKNAMNQAATNSFALTEVSQKQLLTIARESIETYLNTGKLKAFGPASGELTAPGAVFVTLTQQGQLRGCIGTTEPRGPLYEAVEHLAIAAAVEDGRFTPLTLAELPRTHIEVSVLSPLRRVKSAAEIREHTDGVVVRRGGRSGLFLPQVWEHFATKEDFLDELCRQKAHLPAKAWMDPDTELSVFTVFAFEEPAR